MSRGRRLKHLTLFPVSLISFLAPGPGRWEILGSRLLDTPASDILENWGFCDMNLLEHILQVCNRWTGLFLTLNRVLFQQNSEDNTGPSEKQKRNETPFSRDKFALQPKRAIFSSIGRGAVFMLVSGQSLLRHAIDEGSCKEVFQIARNLEDSFILCNTRPRWNEGFTKLLNLCCTRVCFKKFEQLKSSLKYPWKFHRYWELISVNTPSGNNWSNNRLNQEPISLRYRRN